MHNDRKRRGFVCVCICIYIYIKGGSLAHCLGENLSSRSLDEVVSFF